VAYRAATATIPEQSEPLHGRDSPGRRHPQGQTAYLLSRRARGFPKVQGSLGGRGEEVAPPSSSFFEFFWFRHSALYGSRGREKEQEKRKVNLAMWTVAIVDAVQYGARSISLQSAQSKDRQSQSSSAD